MTEIPRLVLAVIACQLAGIIGSAFTFSSIPTWYASLDKPLFNPPNWIFGPVWLTLYTLMGISLYLVWRKGLDRDDVRKALAVFGVQLILNALWSILFFGLRNPLAGLAEIAILWLFIVLSIALFYRISRPAGTLLLPYLLWVSFAMFLNYNIWILNP